MTLFEVLQKWLGNRQRSYADGVALFKVLATATQLEKYGAYFDAAPKAVGVWDHHFTMLIDQLSKIYRGITSTPKLYPAAKNEYQAPIEAADSEKNEKVAEMEKQIMEHEERMAELRQELDDVQESMPDADVTSIEEQLCEHAEAIETLKKSVEELSKPGVKVVTVDSMPASIKAAYDRIKEITPLYAHLHAEIADEHKSDEERKPLAEELCKLDDERRKLWAKIDAWSEGKGTLEIDEQRPTYSDNATVRGYELARAVVRLKSNIKNAKDAAKRAKADGKETIYQNALKRLEKYEKELSEIEKELGSAE